MTEESQTLWTGKFLAVRRRGTWEYAVRPNARAVVGIVAVTVDQEIILVEQFRRPVDCPVIELPAGLVGDEAGGEHESCFTAAQRELVEETGYTSSQWSQLSTGPSSAGLTDEVVTLLLARNAQRESAGGGVGSEAITVHLIALDRVDQWLDEQIRGGRLIDFKLFAGLYFLRRAAPVP
ncbi:MAG: NUDIX hydrolase [Aureliella sp.]|jgi:ADP-ribose pyrophosphatase